MGIIFRSFVLMLLCPLVASAAESRIYAQIVTAAGVTSGSPIVVYSGAAGPQSRPRVSFYNDRFLVVWNEWNGSDMDVKGARIEMDGTVLDTTPISISTGTRTQAMPDVAADSTGWMVVYHRFPTGEAFPSLYAKRVNYDGTTGSESSAIGNADASMGAGAKLSWNATTGKFLLMYTTFLREGRAIQRLEWGLLTTSGGFTRSTDYGAPVKNSPEEFEIAPMPGTGGWTYIMNGTPSSWYSSVGKIDMAGAVSIESTGLLNANGWLGSGDNLIYQGAHSSEFLAYPNEGVAWVIGDTAAVADSTYVVGAWTQYAVDYFHHLENPDLYAARIDEYLPEEALGGTAIANTSADEVNPALAGDGAGNVLLAYEKITSGSSEIIGKILTIGTSISVGIEIDIRDDSTNGSRRTNPHVAYGDDGAGETAFLVVWTEGWWGI